MKRFFKMALFLGVSALYGQQGGMWIPSLLEGMNAKEMKTLGMKMSVADIYSVNKSSLKDAAPHFNGGCSSEIISDKGLLLTNHHCGYGQIQAQSSLQNDYLTHGFWAKNLSEELPNKNLKVTFIVRIDDVTKQVLAGTQQITDETQKAKLIEQNIAQAIKTAPKEAWQENSVKAFYDGNQYILFVTETFKDVRLVGAPPSSIGKFGSDTDNWVWPRHTGDFSLFRVYADKNNRPAEYSKDNVPYKPKHFFPISIKGVKEGDFVMVFGYPGTTQEYLPSVAVEQIVNTINPARIGIRDVALKIQDGFMRKDNSIKIKYASKYARTANYWKKWIGETKGLKKSDAVSLKKQQEIKFQQNIEKANKQAEYGNLLPEFNQLYKEFEPYNLAYNLYSELMYRTVDFLSNGVRILQMQQVLDKKGEQAFADRKKNMLSVFESVFKDNVKQVDKEVFEKIIVFYAEQMPKNLLVASLQNFDAKQLADKLYANSFLTSYEGIEKVLALSPAEFKEQLKNDIGVQFAAQLMDMNDTKVYPNYTRISTQIHALQRTYMKAILEFSKPSDRIFPDANSTLRVTYGKVAGFSPADGVDYAATTTLDGVMEKYVPGDYEFDVPQKLRELYAKKDYGRYGQNGKMPLCFISTCHTTGGNSGSPAIDANGNLIGINFDRVWEGTMSDIHYDPKLCRNIMMDMRYFLFIVDKYAGAGYLLNEMKIVK